jgi:hypothetical protein
VCNSATFMITLFCSILDQLYSPHNVPPAVCSSAPLLKARYEKDMNHIVAYDHAVANSLHIPDAVREFWFCMANDMLARGGGVYPVSNIPTQTHSHIPRIFTGLSTDTDRFVKVT